MKPRPPPPALEPLLPRLHTARGARARRQLARDLVEALARPGAAPAHLHALLAHPALPGLRDGRGRSVRAAAVEALLALGYPHALEVAPEDLAHARAAARGRGRRAALGLALLLVLAALATALYALASRDGSAVLLVYGLAGVALLLGALAWAGPGRYLPAPARGPRRAPGGAPRGSPPAAGDVRRVD